MFGTENRGLSSITSISSKNSFKEILLESFLSIYKYNYRINLHFDLLYM